MSSLLEKLFKNRKIKALLGTLLPLLAVFLAAVSIPQESYTDLSEYYGVSEGETAVFVDDVLSEVHALRENDTCYLPLSYVQESLNSRFYWDEETEGVLYAMPDRLLTFLPEGLTCLSDETPVEAASAPLILREDVYYLSLEIVSEHTELSFQYYEDPGRLWIQTTFDRENVFVNSREELSVHAKASRFSKLVTKTAENEMLRVISEEKDWLLVVTDEGHYGYVQEKRTETALTLRNIPEKSVTENYYGPLFSGKLSIGFDYIDHQEYCMDSIQSHLDNGRKVNVLAPTWFVLTGSDGSFTSCGDPAYVSLAHENDLQVWVMIENITGGADTGATLHSRKSREALIQNLVTEVTRLGADGINLDFESLSAEIVTDYLEFIRELKRVCLEKDLVLSADTYGPFSWNEKYNLPELSEILDYVIIMGYDESWNTPGPNSDKEFISFICEKSLETVPAERLVIAVPFYTRGWVEGDDGFIRSEITMKRCRELMTACEDLTWLEDKGCYYGHVEDDGVGKEVWFEDVRSMEERLKIISESELKGIACWRLFQEDPEVWPLVEKYILTD